MSWGVCRWVGNWGGWSVGREWGWGDGGYRVGVGGLGLCHPTPSNLKNILDTASRIIFLPLCH